MNPAGTVSSARLGGTLRAASGTSGANRRQRTGVSISPTSLCAVDVRFPSSDHAWRTQLEAPTADGASWPSLASALVDLARALSVTEGTLVVALMPPLTEVRRLDLPPVSGDELQRLLTRNAGRYFTNARGPQIVGSAPLPRRGRNAPVPVVAATASARLVAAIRAAAQQAGWTVDSIIPAEGAWAAASLALWPALGRQIASALIAHDDRTDMLQLENGRLVGVRRFRAGASAAPMIADTLGQSARVGVVGSLDARSDLTAALQLHGVTVASLPPNTSHAADSVDLLAARHADSEIGPVLRNDDRVAFERGRARSAAWFIAAGTAALLVLAAGMQYWGVRRQLRLVEAERARLRPQLSSTLLGRTTVDAAYAQLAALAAIERSSPQWSSVIARLSQAVPRDAYLTAIRARDDSLVVDGLADHAARVFDALAKTRGFVDVKSAASVRRELAQQGRAKEHFTIAARVAAPSAPRTAP